MKKIYAFSGLDGAGKSTQIDLLKQHFEKQGKSVKVVWSRGGYTPLFEFLKNTLSRKKSSNQSSDKVDRSELRTKRFNNPIIRKTWLSIAIVDLLLLYAFYFRLLVWSGKQVIADRYIEDTVIDFRLNFPEEKVERWLLWKFMKLLTPTPQKHLMLLIPVAESMRRSVLKNEPFPDDEETLKARLSTYQSFLSSGSYFVYLDGMNTIEDIHNQIVSELV